MLIIIRHLILKIEKKILVLGEGQNNGINDRTAGKKNCTNFPKTYKKLPFSLITIVIKVTDLEIRPGFANF